MLGAAWYGQGLRLLDISDARDVEQVGYYRVTGTSDANPSSNSWDVAFRTTRGRSGQASSLVYLFDMSRGVEVLRIKGGGAQAASRMKAVTAPSALKRDRFAAQPVGSLSASTGGTSFVCPLFAN